MDLDALIRMFPFHSIQRGHPIAQYVKELLVSRLALSGHLFHPMSKDFLVNFVRIPALALSTRSISHLSRMLAVGISIMLTAWGFISR
ncbi:hypothetical protein GYMLUDRAFT_966079 [Collybiopsis luxurians FD-317 M1]|uniref:Uncharacterized protein n=1 Tax=Collybiopsis luxurians FD-317 M1 TaxID=944289 RepID=A0A0D0C3T3_9AGAR|nr:hypothetical protein GYMLUDRAFT_966079 [Collybiopsis luxurians FD-317 M1]